MKLTRRELAGVVAAGTVVARAAAQASSEAAETPEQLAQSALQEARKTAAEIRKVKLPLDTEPAFGFRAQ